MKRTVKEYECDSCEKKVTSSALNSSKPADWASMTIKINEDRKLAKPIESLVCDECTPKILDILMVPHSYPVKSAQATLTPSNASPVSHEGDVTEQPQIVS